jgi:hypothetical protein
MPCIRFLVAHLEGEAEGVCYAALDKAFLETVRTSMPIQVSVLKIAEHLPTVFC